MELKRKCMARHDSGAEVCISVSQRNEVTESKGEVR